MGEEAFNLSDVVALLSFDRNPPYLMGMEKGWNGCGTWSAWLRENPVYPGVFALLYLALVHLGPHVMTMIYGPLPVVKKDDSKKSKEKEDDKKKPKEKPKEKKIDYVLALWNLSLSLFSIFGATRTVPRLLQVFEERHFVASVCGNVMVWCNTPAGLWVFLFILSKVPELIDTAFLVVKRKNIGFLHWYHHTTVMIFCWMAGAHLIMPGLWFAAMNLCVHSVMYFYYFLTSVNIMWVKKYFDFPITVMQISQMIMGVIIVFTVAYHQFFTEEGCESATLPHTIYALVMYGSYLYLFVEFFVKRYLLGGKDKVE